MNSVPNNVICLYSKFSSNSKNFVEAASNLPINFICIDNKDIRNRIISDSKLTISFVPCILCLFSDGRLEKYEGTDAFSWLEDIKKEVQPQTVQPQTVQPQTVQPQTVHSQTVQPQTVQPTLAENKTKNYDPNNESKYSQHDFHSKQNQEKHSKISDINFEDNSEKIINKVSTGMKDSLSDKENLMIKSLNKISTKNSGKRDVMAAAREMEKSREMDESSKPRPLNMPKI